MTSDKKVTHVTPWIIDHGSLEVHEPSFIFLQKIMPGAFGENSSQIRPLIKIAIALTLPRWQRISLKLRVAQMRKLLHALVLPSSNELRTVVLEGKCKLP